MEKILFFLVPTVLLSFAINRLIILTPLKHAYQFLVRPGIIIHELSHYIACLITFAEVKKVSLFQKDGGFVKYSSSKIPILGDFIINIAPIIVGSILIILLSKKLNITISQNPKTIIQDSIAIFKTNYAIFNFWIFLYAIITIGITLVPSTKDITNIILPLILIFAVLYFFRNSSYAGSIFQLFSDYGLYVVSPLFFVFTIVLSIYLVSRFVLRLS
ncbi:MAG: M50 family metallopeptidase [Patescibacteria group bacterium]|jgi:hypothetical protein